MGDTPHDFVWRLRKMSEMIGRSAKIMIKDPVKGEILYYTAKIITKMTNTHLFFIDKFDNELGFRLLDVLQLHIT
jgi:hypothetical protein